MSLNRFRDAQQERTLRSPRLPQPSANDNYDSPSEKDRHSPKHSFVVCADSQLGMTTLNQEWETELAYCREVVKQINAIEPRPTFCCVCGDLVDMEHTFYVGKGFTKEECDSIQDQQNLDFQSVFSKVHEDIALVCLCGNHDVGNRPTNASMERYRNAFGDDYLAFWVNGTYNIVLNSCVFSDPSGARELYEQQLAWLEERLKYSQENNAANVFVFSHHPWFLYKHDEGDDELTGVSPYPKEWGPREGGFPDYYFHIPKKYRMKVMDLFREYEVSAAFSGHFHQNLVSKSSWGMEMIITAPMSMVFESTGKPKDYDEPNGRGIRIVEVEVDPNGGPGRFHHRFELS